MKTIEQQTKDATAEVWGKALETAGCPPFLLVLYQDGRVSAGSTIEGPVLLQIMDTLKGEYEKAAALARRLESGRS